MTSTALRITLAALLLALIIATPAAMAKEGDVCDIPKFDIAWPDSINPNLVVDLKDPGVLSLRITGRDKTGADLVSHVGRRYYHAGRNIVRVDLTHLDFYLSNTITINYKGWETNNPRRNGNVCAGRKQGEVQVVAFERQLLKFDAGSAFVRNKDDGFDTVPEIAVSATSRWKKWITGGVDFRLSQLAQLEEETMPMEPEPTEPAGDNPAGGTGEMTEDEDEDVFNPFTEEGTIVRGDLYVVFHPKPDNRADQVIYPPPLGIVLGGGFSTFSGDSDSVQTRQRYFYGLRLQVQGYNRKKTPEKFGGTTGFVQFGAARDELWKYQSLDDHDGDPATDMIAVDRDERDRYFVEAALEFPNLGGQRGRLALRVYADLPQSGNGPSDLRFSVLAAIDLKALGGALGVGG